MSDITREAEEEFALNSHAAQTKRIAELEAERDTAKADLKAYLDDTAVTCAYCEARHERPVTFEDIRAHVETCPKHPLGAAQAHVRELEAQVQRLEEALNRGIEFARNQRSNLDRKLSDPPQSAAACEIQWKLEALLKASLRPAKDGGEG